MNEFTKAELIEIHEYCNAWKGLGMSDFRVNLWDKIQILIDNYEDNKPPLQMAECVCSKCNEEWRLCECRHA